LSKADEKKNNLHYICNALTKQPLTQIIRNYQPKSLNERYRRHKNPLRYDFKLENPYPFMQRLKHYYITKEDVDLNVIKPKKFEVCLIVKIFFLRLNNSHLPKKFEAFLEELKARTQESRKEEKKKSKQIRDFRKFLRRENVSKVRSTKSRNEFRAIRLLYNSFLAGKTYSKKQKEFLRRLQNRSRIREIQVLFKREKNNAILNDLGEPLENSDNERDSPLIEEESSRPSSKNTSLLIKNGEPKMVENDLCMENIHENILVDNDNEKPCEGCPKQLTKEFCPYCKYYLLYQRRITDVNDIVELNLDEFNRALEQDSDQVIGVESSREDLLEGPLKGNAKNEILSVDNDEVVVENLRKKNLPKKEKNKPKRFHLKLPVIKKKVKIVLDLTVHKRRQRNFLNGIKNASITDVLIESSLSATRPEKELQEREHNGMGATRSRKKVAGIVKIKPKHAPRQLSDNAKTLIKNVGIIHILCLFFLPSFLFVTIPKTEITSFLGLFLLLTYLVVSLYVISFSIRSLLLRKNRFRKLTFRLRHPLIKSLKIFRHELEENAFNLDEIQKNGTKKTRLKYKNRFEEIKISKNPKNKDKNKQKQTIRGRKAFFSFLLTEVYDVKTGNNLEEVRKRTKKRAKFKEINRVENIEITFKRPRELARNKRVFYDFLLEKVFGKKHLKNNKLKHPISHLRPKKKKTKVKVVRRKRSVGLFRNSNRFYNESFENNSTNNSFTVPRKEDLKKIQELNKEIPLKSFRIVHYHDMESRIEYEENLTQKYRKEEGIPDSYLVNEKIRDISDSDRVIGLYLEKNHREKFDKFFNRNLTLAKLLNYSTDLSLIKIAKNRDKWTIIADLNTDNNVLKQQLSNLLEKVSKSILIFKDIELSYRREYNRILLDDPYVKLLIPLQLQLNLIELSQNAKLINKNLKFWLVSRKERRRFEKLLKTIRTSYQILNYADLIGLATLKARDVRLPE